MAGPLLSVVIPVLHGKFLEEAISTVRRSSVGPLEILLVDDGSEDGIAAETAQRLGHSIIYMSQATAGPAGARNRGLAAAEGEFVAFIDADDLWAETHPAAALAHLREHPGVDVVLGQVQFLTRTPDATGFLPTGKRFHTYQLGAAVVRRQLFDRIGSFDAAMRYGEDVDWFLRVRESGAALAMLPELALYYRLHPGNRPTIYQSSRAGLLDAFHHALQRKRDTLDPARDKTPLISVIIPVRNGERFIGEAIESVFAQDYRPVELIVVDDGSSDRTREIVATFPQATLLTQPPRGAGIARNAGVRSARGEFLAFLDADDFWLPGKLTRQMEELKAHPELEAVFSHLEELREEKGAVTPPRPGPIAGTMLIRRQAFVRIGWFNEEAGSLEGVDWHLRATEKSLRARMLPQTFYRRRIHNRNRSIVERDLQGYVRAIKDSLDRRRRAAGPPAC